MRHAALAAAGRYGRRSALCSLLAPLRCISLHSATLHCAPLRSVTLTLRKGAASRSTAPFRSIALRYATLHLLHYAPFRFASLARLPALPQSQPDHHHLTLSIYPNITIPASGNVRNVTSNKFLIGGMRVPAHTLGIRNFNFAICGFIETCQGAFLQSQKICVSCVICVPFWRS